MNKASGEDYSRQFILTNEGFSSSKPHFIKLVNVLRTIYEKQPVSKWDLSTVDEKKGFLPYSWVLVHKLVKELTSFNLVRSLGVKTLSDKEKKMGKKHNIPIFGLTDKGLIFLLMLDKKLASSFIAEKVEKKDTGHYIWIFTNYIWQMEYITPIKSTSRYNIPIRTQVTNSILQNVKSTDINEILLDATLSDIINVTKNMTSQLSHQEHMFDGLFPNMVYLLMLGFQLGSVKFENEKINKQLSYSLLMKIIFLELQLDIIKRMWFELTLCRWPDDKSVEELKIAIMRGFLNLSHHMRNISLNREQNYNFSELMSIIEPAVKSADDLSRKMGLLQQNESIVTKQIDEDEKVKNEIIQVLQNAIIRRQRKQFFQQFSEKVYVELGSKYEPPWIRGRGISFVEKWLDSIPKDCKLLSSRVFLDDIDTDVILKTNDEIKIAHIKMSMKKNRKIKRFAVWNEHVRDLKYEKEISELRPDSANPYSKLVVKILKGMYKSMLPNIEFK